MLCNNTILHVLQNDANKNIFWRLSVIYQASLGSVVCHSFHKDTVLMPLCTARSVMLCKHKIILFQLHKSLRNAAASAIFPIKPLYSHDLNAVNMQFLHIWFCTVLSLSTLSHTLSTSIHCLLPYIFYLLSIILCSVTRVIPSIWLNHFHLHDFNNYRN